MNSRILSMNPQHGISATTGLIEPELWLDVVQRQVQSLKYGMVQIVVHNSCITQIERTERLRLDPPPALLFAQSTANPQDH